MINSYTILVLTISVTALDRLLYHLKGLQTVKTSSLDTMYFALTEYLVIIGITAFLLCVLISFSIQQICVYLVISYSEKDG